MNGWLLDTNVVSELRKKRPYSRVKAWSDAQAADSLFLSSVTLAEIRYGIERQPDLKFRNELARWLNDRLRPWFASASCRWTSSPKSMNREPATIHRRRSLTPATEPTGPARTDPPRAFLRLLA